MPLFIEERAEDRYQDTTGNKDKDTQQGTSDERAPGNFLESRSGRDS